jgi:hypothetical protein
MPKSTPINSSQQNRSTELTWQDQNTPTHLLRDEYVDRLKQALDFAKSSRESEK